MFNGNKFKLVTLKGRTFKVQGHEDQVIRWLVETKGVDVHEINVWSSRLVPSVQYRFKGRVRTHKPDLMVRGKVIEVKSVYTLGLTKQGLEEDWLGKHKAMARAALKQGLDYRVVVVTDSVIVLPRLWFQATLREVREMLKGAAEEI
jgi:hypothetical protein